MHVPINVEHGLMLLFQVDYVNWLIATKNKLIRSEFIDFCRITFVVQSHKEK
jgi:hypothetical protein